MNEYSWSDEKMSNRETDDKYRLWYSWQLLNNYILSLINNQQTMYILLFEKAKEGEESGDINNEIGIDSYVSSKL
jgi:hypothetical protein